MPTKWWSDGKLGTRSLFDFIWKLLLLALIFKVCWSPIEILEFSNQNMIRVLTPQQIIKCNLTSFIFIFLHLYHSFLFISKFLSQWFHIWNRHNIINSARHHTSSTFVTSANGLYIWSSQSRSHTPSFLTQMNASSSIASIHFLYSASIVFHKIPE